MTIARNSGGARADDAGWPWSHRKTFLERLGAQGYAAVTIQEARDSWSREAPTILHFVSCQSEYRCGNFALPRPDGPATGAQLELSLELIKPRL